MAEWTQFPRMLGRALGSPLGRRVAALVRMGRDREIGPVEEQPWDNEEYVAAGTMHLNRLLPRWEQYRNLVDFLLPFEAMLPGIRAVAVEPPTMGHGGLPSLSSNRLRIRAFYPGTGTTVQFDIDHGDRRGLDIGLAHAQRVQLAVSSRDEAVANVVVRSNGPWYFPRDFPSLVLGLRAIPQLVVHGEDLDSVRRFMATGVHPAPLWFPLLNLPPHTISGLLRPGTFPRFHTWLADWPGDPLDTDIRPFLVRPEELCPCGA